MDTLPLLPHQSYIKAGPWLENGMFVSPKTEWKRCCAYGNYVSVCGVCYW